MNNIQLNGVVRIERFEGDAQSKYGEQTQSAYIIFCVLNYDLKVHHVSQYRKYLDYFMLVSSFCYPGAGVAV